MKNRVLVINPCVTDFKLYDEWMHPAGLYFLLDLLKLNQVETYYFDCLAESISGLKKFGTGEYGYKELEKPLLYSNIKRKYKIYGISGTDLEKCLSRYPVPDLVLTGSSMTYWGPGVVETIKIVRRCFPDVPVLIGGIAAQLIPDYFKSKFTNCHTAGSLFSEDTLQLIKQYINDFSFCNVESPSMSGGLGFLPKMRHGPVLLSLGCPMSCSYCASRVLQPHFRPRPVKTVLKEVLYVHQRFGVQDFAFYDDALLYRSRDGLIPFLAEVKKTGLDLRFHTPNGFHLRLLNREILEIMKDSGFRTLRFGYESGDPKHSDETESKAGIEMLAEKISLARKAGFTKKEMGVYLMGGLKGQLPEDMMKEMEQTGALGVQVKPVFLSPVPRTRLFKYYAVQFPSLRSDPLWHNDSFFISCLPGWDWDSVEQIRRKAREINSVQEKADV